MLEHQEGAEQEPGQDVVVPGHGCDTEQQNPREEAIVLEVNVIHHEEASVAKQQDHHGVLVTESLTKCLTMIIILIHFSRLGRVMAVVTSAHCLTPRANTKSVTITVSL